MVGQPEAPSSPAPHDPSLAAGVSAPTHTHRPAGVSGASRPAVTGGWQQGAGGAGGYAPGTGGAEVGGRGWQQGAGKAGAYTPGEAAGGGGGGPGMDEDDNEQLPATPCGDSEELPGTPCDDVLPPGGGAGSPRVAYGPGMIA